MVVGVNGDDAKKTAQMLRDAGGQAEYQQADVSDPKAIERVIEPQSSFGSSDPCQ